ncbi:hypothetical protein, partial [Streptosporangium sp. NPDC003464]
LVAGAAQFLQLGACRVGLGAGPAAVVLGGGELGGRGVGTAALLGELVVQRRRAGAGGVLALLGLPLGLERRDSSPRRSTGTAAICPCRIPASGSSRNLERVIGLGR